MTIHRKIKAKFLCEEIRPGKGISARQPIGSDELHQLDPFLRLDDVKLECGAGIPDHPHRGFETITYMLGGTVQHEDSCGHEGMLHEGDVQWITTGRGILHTAHAPTEEGAWGLQLWLNLKAKDKMCEPNYQERRRECVPKESKDGVSVSVITGESLEMKSDVQTRTPNSFIDFTMKPGSKHTQAVPKGWNCFLYTLSGTTCIAGEEVPSHHTVVLEEGDVVVMENKSNNSCRLILLAGEPINEPVVVKGNYAMNTQEEIQAAIRDVTSRTNGFEKAPTWRSSIKRDVK